MAPTQRPRVLVVVPTLGTRPAFLRDCLDSLRNQTYPRLRVVLVGPSDGSVRNIASTHDVDFVTDPARGIGGAINAAWRAFGQEAEIWGWLGDDDLLPRDSVRSAVEALQQPNAVMVFGQCRYIDAEGHTLWTAKPTRLAAINLGGGVDLIPQPGSLYCADAVRRVGFVDEELRYAMDYDLFLKLRKVGRLIYLPRILASFRWHDGSLTASHATDSNDEAMAVRRRHRSGRKGQIAGYFEPLTMKASKLHWHLQRRPVSVMLAGFWDSLR